MTEGTNSLDLHLLDLRHLDRWGSGQINIIMFDRGEGGLGRGGSCGDDRCVRRDKLLSADGTVVTARS